MKDSIGIVVGLGMFWAGTAIMSGLAGYSRGEEKGYNKGYVDGVRTVWKYWQEKSKPTN